MNQEKPVNKKEELRLRISSLKNELGNLDKTIELYPGEESEMTRKKRDGIHDQLVSRERELQELEGK